METKEKIIQKLKELGIDSDNCYPKKTFMKNFELVVGVFASEFESDCYFAGDYGKKLYKIPATTKFKAMYEKDTFQGKDKWLVPVSSCQIVWEDKAFVELPNSPFSSVTLREYACIHLKLPQSGNPWLDTLIKESITNSPNSLEQYNYNNHKPL